MRETEAVEEMLKLALTPQIRNILTPPECMDTR